MIQTFEVVTDEQGKSPAFAKYSPAASPVRWL